ncbi:bifunctional glutamate--cysteine ligase GshA/glutathione synthetase GshB [Clostridium sp. BJN0001]|uniref:bifunctional glutamate--cysteine ligase GshA/glutathione synthetase GshB n=1 Tax=Clostridium sp. BJN0001 TaxID=2930219 RepID=UPI001FD38E5C|nr:bifunctional glutamate--cysteine ligase GshA/glutathione synthetase GshB [Clostridium sp. BJN0001]
MINKIKKLFNSYELSNMQNFGIEREGLRVNDKGILSSKKHPLIFGEKNKNPYITTDFSESQIEVITPVFTSSESIYNFSNILYDIVSDEIGDEYIWPQSMPCMIKNEIEIKVSEFNGSEEEEYRKRLLKKYGGKRQLISGIHYNCSFKDEFFKKIYENQKEDISYKEFKNNIYLKICRNYLKYMWLLIYLTGASPSIHKSYVPECIKKSYKDSSESYSSDGLVSYRNSECGYKNKVDIYPCYDSLDSYIDSIKEYISLGVIDTHKELYSLIRVKPSNKNNFFESLKKDGINYLEYRCIDVNPFEKGGISLNDLKFLELFNFYLLLKDEDNYENWHKEALYNQNLVAKAGLSDINILRNGEKIRLTDYAEKVLKEISYLNKALNLNKEDIITEIQNKIRDKKLTYAYKISEKIKNEGYVNTFMSLAEKYKKDAFNNRFGLYGYEDLELSTQILMRESIKRGIETKLIDRKENFIELKKNGKTEYVKQATKTSKDSYVSVLVMENKSITKKILHKNNIKVPRGIEIFSLENSEKKIEPFINKAVVIKPKSTNFGTGITVFKNNAQKEDIMKALFIAFKFDNTVLIEEFIKGNEYRFLIIGEKVCGILKRVPANVEGDGKSSIRELVKIKNKDPLRGYHYVKPLEKINIDENVLLYLKCQNKDPNYIPKKGEKVYLRENSNISTGGDSIDYTQKIPDRFKKIAIKCANAVNAKICGVDMIIEDISDENSKYGIIELNFNPAIHIHCYPYIGKERNIAEEILKLLKLT